MSNKKDEINQTAQIIVDMLGWDPGYSKTSIRAYNYPYAISFTKNREMMMIKMTKHPHLEWVDGHLHLNTKIVVPTHLSPRFAVSEIETRLLPRVFARTLELLSNGKLVHSGLMPYGKSDVGL